MADERPGQRTRFGQMLHSKYYLPVSLCVTVVLLVGITLAVLHGPGGWSLTLPQAHSAVVITGAQGELTQATTVQAYILGAVRTPGVYAVASGSRVRDLVQAAGGLLDTADVARVNLAALVVDGQEIYVPRVGESVSTTAVGKVAVNSASADTLHTALGISLTTARAIVAYRTAHGPFTAVSQLLLVPISRTIYDRIKNLVIV